MRRARFRVAPILNPTLRASQKTGSTSVDLAGSPNVETNNIGTISDTSESVFKEVQQSETLFNLPSTAVTDVQPQKPETKVLPAKKTPLLEAYISSPLPSNISQDLNGQHQNAASIQHIGTSESEDSASSQLSRPTLSLVKKPSPALEVCDLEKDVKMAKARKSKREKTALDMKKDALKKKLAKGNIDRSQLTMFDLIYYNPVEPDKPPRVPEKLQMRLKPYEAAALTEEKSKENSLEGTDIIEERLAEEEETIRFETGGGSEDEEKQEEKEEVVESQEDDEDEAMPVPQVRLGPDGEIILDDKSLVIETTEAKRTKSMLQNAPVIVENSNTLVNYGSWAKRPRSARWSLKETARFYKALAMLGTNFSMMEKLFPKRPRVELKRKFKLEEKNNHQLVDKILAKQIPFDPSQFLDKDGVSESDDEKGKESKMKSRKRKGVEDKDEGRQREHHDNSGSSAKPKRKKSYQSQSIVDSDSSEEQNAPRQIVRISNSLDEADGISLSEPVSTVEHERLEKRPEDSAVPLSIQSKTGKDQTVEKSDKPATLITPDANETQVCNVHGYGDAQSEEHKTNGISKDDEARSEEVQVYEATKGKDAPQENEVNRNTTKDDGTTSEEKPNSAKQRSKLRGRVKPNISSIVRKTDEANVKEASFTPK